MHLPFLYPLCESSKLCYIIGLSLQSIIFSCIFTAVANSVTLLYLARYGLSLFSCISVDRVILLSFGIFSFLQASLYTSRLRVVLSYLSSPPLFNPVLALSRYSSRLLPLSQFVDTNWFFTIVFPFMFLVFELIHPLQTVAPGSTLSIYT